MSTTQGVPDIQRNTLSLLTRMLETSRAATDARGAAIEQTMRALAPAPDDPREGPEDYRVTPAHPAALTDGGRLRVAYVDPLGTLSPRDIPPIGEDTRIVLDVVAAEGPLLLDDLRKVWH